MARNKRLPIDGNIPNWEAPWDDGTNAYTAGQVRTFLKEQFAETQTALGEKFGAVSFEGTKLTMYDHEGGTALSVVDISGTSYIINLNADRDQTFYVLTSQEEALITIAPTTKEVHLGSSEQETVNEDYTFRLDVDNGNGYVDRTPPANTITSGGSASVDIRSYLTTGANRVRLIVTGQMSEQPKAVVFNVNLTSLNLSVDHSWHKAWIEGEDYAINGIFFGGNLAKRLYVKIGNRTYTQDFSAATQYTSVAYSFNLKDRFPSEGTGVYDVQVWMEGGDVRTRVYNYRIMCVGADDTATAQLICINQVPDKAVNYMSQTLFQYATFNLTSVTLDIDAHIGSETVAIVDNQEMSVQTQTKNPFTTTLQIETQAEVTTDLTLDIALSGGSATESVVGLTIDNSNAFTATPDAAFYLNPGIRSNNRSDREEIHNTAANAAVASYEAQWRNFTFMDDAWATDSEGHKCLAVMAGSTLDIVPTDPEGSKYKPLDTSATSSLTVEWMYRADNIADYDTPVFSIMSTEEFSQSASRGIILFPTRLLVYDSVKKDAVYQKLDLPENRIIHIAVVLQRNYANNGRNLCRIYINGRENLTYEYTGSHAEPEGGYGYVRMGQPSTDFYLYMMRSYTRALEAAAIHANFINALIDTAEVSKAGEKKDNNIINGNAISYDLCKKAGFNCMVIESEADIPSLANPNVSSNVNLRLEYNDHPEWNVIVYNIPIAGQGTTSMKYYKWNLTHKIKDPVRWVYPNRIDTNTNQPTEETRVDGYIAGYGLHPRASKITSKKNIASSPQGHKMGATAMYHEVFVACEGTDMLPNADCRTATYQYPFIGFRKFGPGNEDYEFIGLYTVGPDKKDLQTFGYSETAEYPKLMMIEGPNHAPLMTRFLVPWTDDVHYDYGEETLCIGSGANVQEGWDADIAAAYKTDKADYAAAVFALYESEFKPAYDAIYYCSPYIKSLSEAGFSSLDQLNANVDTFRSSEENKLYTFYDPADDFQLVYFDYANQRYARLSSSVHNIRSYLGLSGNPTTADILAARAAKFVSEDSGVFKYVSKNEALFHECFCELLGVSDNFAKNTYWRKFRSLLDGGKWGFNEDDLDTLFANDNNGQDTKEYSVEPDDVNGTGAEIFQGANSAFWYQLRQCCQSEIRNKMKDIVDKCVILASRYNCAASTKYQSVVNLIRHYFWSQSAKYFPAMAYNEDTLFGYVNVWAIDPTKSYNAVPPLTQIHGDHYETELAWVERRVAYIFSKYKLGDWCEDDNDGFGTLDYTLKNGFDMTVVPAIDIYPAYSVGGATVDGSARVRAGEEHVFHLPAGDATNIYIKGMDWLSDLGDLSGMHLGSRGGVTGIAFNVAGKRLRRLIVGSENPIDKDTGFNATELAVSGQSIEEVNARNVSTLKGSLDLKDCPRLRKSDFRGTQLSEIFLPVGGRVNEAHMPATLVTLFLHSLNLLQADNLDIPDEAYANIENLYFNGCSMIDPIAFLGNILSGTNKLKFVTMAWDGERTLTDQAAFDALATLVDNAYNSETGIGVGALGYENGRLVALASAPNIQGDLYIPFSVYEDSCDTILQKLPNLHLRYNPELLYIRFEDENVYNIMLAHMHDDYGYEDEVGITRSAAAKVRGWLPSDLFTSNTQITHFNEYKYFTGTHIVYTQAFNNCTSLQSVEIPHTIDQLYGGAFSGCPSLRVFKFDNRQPFAADAGVFTNTHIAEVHITNLSNWIASTFNSYTANPLQGGGKLYLNGEEVTQLDIPEGTTEIKKYAFDNCKNEMEVVLPDGLQKIYSCAFRYCSNAVFSSLPNSLKTLANDVFQGTKWRGPLTIPASLTSISTSIFDGATGLTAITYASDLNVPDYTFKNTDITSVTITGEVQGINIGAFQGCTSLASVSLPSSLTTISQDVFKGCTALKTVSIPPSVTSIGISAFAGCTALKRVDITDIAAWLGISFGNAESNPLRYGASLYLNDAEVTELNIPENEGITEIKNYAFYGCSSITSVTVPGSVKNIGQFAFMGSTIQSITLPESLTEIGASAFNGSGLKSVVIPDSLTEIVGNTFKSCTSLKKVVIGSGVTGINNDAFISSPIASMIMRPTTPPTLGTNNVSAANPPLIYVPNGSVTDYQEATNWPASRIHPMSELYPSPSVDGLIDTAGTYISAGTSTEIDYRLNAPIAVMPVINEETQERLPDEAYTIRAEIVGSAYGITVNSTNTALIINAPASAEGRTITVNISLYNDHNEVMWTRTVSILIGSSSE